MPTLSREQEDSILESAVLAPSADNHHRIVFERGENTLWVRGTEPLLLRSDGYKRVLALLSLGALAENLSIAASRLGVVVEMLLLPDPARTELLLHCRLQAQEVQTDPLYHSIPLRHTNRALLFRGPRMSDVEQAELGAAVLAYPGSRLLWFDSREQRRPVLQLMRRAETERFRNRLLHAELFSAIRFDVGWHTSCAEGLPPGSLGVESALRPFFALLRHWPMERLANMFGLHQLLGARSCYLPCRLAPHLGVLAVTNPDQQSIFEAGRSFQRLWLAATGHGRVLQPMPASALYAWPGAVADGIPAGLQATLAAGWRVILGDACPVMLFRMGFAPQSSIVTGRRQVGDYLKHA